MVKITKTGNVELVCSFLHTEAEFQQIDLKWFKDTDEQPFLQWVPSYGKEPQVLRMGDHLMIGMTVGHRSMNTTKGYRIDQKVVLYSNRTEISGNYSCKVATFFDEVIRTLTLTFFGR